MNINLYLKIIYIYIYMKLKLDSSNLNEMANLLTENYALKIGEFNENETNEIINDIGNETWTNCIFSGDKQFKTGYEKEYTINLDIKDNKFKIKEEDVGKSTQYNSYLKLLSSIDKNKLNCIKELITDKYLIKFISKYFGYKPVLQPYLSYFHSEYNLSKTNEKYNWQQHYHVDQLWNKQQNNDAHYKFAFKIFILLNDVSDNDGPTTTIKGSNDENGIPGNLIYHHLPSSNSGRIINEEWFYKTYSKDRFVKCTGKKGDIFAVRTDGWHCGGRVSEGRTRSTVELSWRNIKHIQAARPDKYPLYWPKYFNKEDFELENLSNSVKVFGEKLVKKSPYYFLLLEYESNK